MVSSDMAPTATTDAFQYVFVCQGRTCLKQGSAKVLAVFQEQLIPGWKIIHTGCLGQCGNGPIVEVLPDRIWYSGVQPDEVPAIVQRHLIGGHPVEAMLYPKFHPRFRSPT